MAIKLNVFVLHGTGNKQVWGKYIINIENGPQKTRWLDGGEDLGSNCPFSSSPAYLYLLWISQSLTICPAKKEKNQEEILWFPTCFWLGQAIASSDSMELLVLNHHQDNQLSFLKCWQAWGNVPGSFASNPTGEAAQRCHNNIMVIINIK